MKVLWLCNIMLPAYARAHNLAFSPREGWLTGCLERIVNNSDAKEKIELGICFPAEGEIASSSEVIDNVKYYGFSEDLEHPEKYDESIEKRFRIILDDFKPDLVHIFGTEFPHTLAMIRTFGKTERILLGIQGLCSCIADEYMANIPESVQKKVTFRDWLKGDSIVLQQEKYRIRGEREKEAIRLCGNIAGRTKFDKDETGKINPCAKYFELNETMRPMFYDGKWDETKVIPHSVFLSQGDYPLKGFHFVLQAMPEILKKYPDAQLFVAGNNIIGKGGSKYPYFLRASAYSKYIRALIAKNKLKKNVTMIGMLSESEMKERFLKSSVFVCPSIVENSPNSVGEAMLLGVPVVAARCGGIPSILQDNKDGLLFEKANPQKLAEAIIQIWDEPVISAVFGENSRKHARITHDPDRNFNRLMEIYEQIYVTSGSGK